MNYPASDSGRCVLWGILIAALAVPAARAQEAGAEAKSSGSVATAPGLAVGQRLRLTVASSSFNGMMVGSLTRIGPESLTLVDADRGAVLDLPMNSVTRIEVGSTHRETKKGALIGLAVGAVLTLAVFASDEPTCGAYLNEPCSTEDNLLLSAFSVGASVGIGAWWGHSKKVDRWLEVPVPHARVGVQLERGGGRARLAVAF